MTRAPAPRTRDSAIALMRPSRSRSSGSPYPLLLTKRDKSICLDLHEHRVLTTEQIFELHFNSSARARVRLRQLYMRGVLARFRPKVNPGSLPWHYTLDELGARIVAAVREIDFERIRFRRDRVLSIANSPRLRHLVVTNGFFCRLAYAGRTQGSLRLAEWWGESRCAFEWKGLVRPDAYGHVINGNRRSLSFFLELDRGTESRSQVEAKLLSYEDVFRFPDAPEALLFCFRTEERERSVREVLRGLPFPVATTAVALHCSDPLGGVWLPIRSKVRVPLLSIPRRQRR